MGEYEGSGVGSGEWGDTFMVMRREDMVLGGRWALCGVDGADIFSGAELMSCGT